MKNFGTVSLFYGLEINAYICIALTKKLANERPEYSDSGQGIDLRRT